MSDDQRSETRRELGAFLKSRRARIAPRDVGLAGDVRRRTPGLRREEVALLAGVGVTWYTWFEQGRDIQVSAHFLERVARALRLDAAERAHLFALAQNRPPPQAPGPASTVTPPLRRMLDSLPGPAYIKTARWDVLAWNPALVAVFGDLARIAPAHRNMLWLVFADPEYRGTMSDWEPDARSMLAKFRLEYGRHGDHPDFVRLVRELSDASPEFRRWWPEQDVLGAVEGVKRFRHPVAGEIEFEHTTFMLDHAPDLRLVVYTPLPGKDARKVRRLRQSLA
ncbi:helix-turn-helix transcriptional regulator [Pendulispora albinea]|uniref:Helix-turn-helix transcriptional regulator n=1 Tax=Pendulispora albinea TaxID=2741071 RepID=A0ABZ2LVX2_9BACT